MNTIKTQHESHYMKLTKNEEDYLKALFNLTVESEDDKVGTNQLADKLGFSPASVNGMLKKLKAKELVSYKKYGKIDLTEQGQSLAVGLIRKHRLWETFLYKYMNFTWDEVHVVAEQLEHIKSEKLVSELDRFLGFPKTDPHGATIPNSDGEYSVKLKTTLAEIDVNQKCKIVAVKDSSVEFLKYVTKIGLELSSEILIIEKRDFDGSILIKFNDQELSVSAKFCENVFVEKLD